MSGIDTTTQQCALILSNDMHLGSIMREMASVTKAYRPRTFV